MPGTWMQITWSRILIFIFNVTSQVSCLTSKDLSFLIWEIRIICWLTTLKRWKMKRCLRRVDLILQFETHTHTHTHTTLALWQWKGLSYGCFQMQYAIISSKKFKPTHKYREQTSGYQWGAGQFRSGGVRGKNYWV